MDQISSSFGLIGLATDFNDSPGGLGRSAFGAEVETPPLAALSGTFERKAAPNWRASREFRGALHSESPYSKSSQIVSESEASPIFANFKIHEEQSSNRAGTRVRERERERRYEDEMKVWDRCNGWYKHRNNKLEEARSKQARQLPFSPTIKKRPASADAAIYRGDRDDSQQSNEMAHDRLRNWGKRYEERLQALIQQQAKDESQWFVPQLIAIGIPSENEGASVVERTMKWKVQQQEKLDERRGRLDPKQVFPFSPEVIGFKEEFTSPKEEDVFERMLKHVDDYTGRLERWRQEKEQKEQKEVDECPFSPQLREVDGFPALGEFDKRITAWADGVAKKHADARENSVPAFEPELTAKTPGKKDWTAERAREATRTKWDRRMEDMQKEIADKEAMILHKRSGDQAQQENKWHERLGATDIEARKARQQRRQEAEKNDVSPQRATSPGVNLKEAKDRAFKRLLDDVEKRSNRKADEAKAQAKEPQRAKSEKPASRRFQQLFLEADARKNRKKNLQGEHSRQEEEFLKGISVHRKAQDQQKWKTNDMNRVVNRLQKRKPGSPDEFPPGSRESISRGHTRRARPHSARGARPHSARAHGRRSASRRSVSGSHSPNGRRKSFQPQPGSPSEAGNFGVSSFREWAVIVVTLREVLSRAYGAIKKGVPNRPSDASLCWDDMDRKAAGALPPKAIAQHLIDTGLSQRMVQIFIAALGKDEKRGLVARSEFLSAVGEDETAQEQSIGNFRSGDISESPERRRPSQAHRPSAVNGIRGSLSSLHPQPPALDLSAASLRRSLSAATTNQTNSPAQPQDSSPANGVSDRRSPSYVQGSRPSSLQVAVAQGRQRALSKSPQPMDPRFEKRKTEHRNTVEMRAPSQDSTSPTQGKERPASRQRNIVESPSPSQEKGRASSRPRNTVDATSPTQGKDRPATRQRSPSPSQGKDRPASRQRNIADSAAPSQAKGRASSQHRNTVESPSPSQGKDRPAHGQQVRQSESLPRSPASPSQGAPSAGANSRHSRGRDQQSPQAQSRSSAEAAGAAVRLSKGKAKEKQSPVAPAASDAGSSEASVPAQAQRKAKVSNAEKAGGERNDSVSPAPAAEKKAPTKGSKGSAPSEKATGKQAKKAEATEKKTSAKNQKQQPDAGHAEEGHESRKADEDRAHKELSNHTQEKVLEPRGDINADSAGPDAKSRQKDSSQTKDKQNVSKERDEPEEPQKEKPKKAKQKPKKAAQKKRGRTIQAAFHLLDQDRSGSLNSQELHRYVLLCGFEDSGEEEWSELYESLCSGYDWNPSAGPNEEEFLQFVNDEEGDGYCDDDELNDIVADLERSLKTKGRP